MSDGTNRYAVETVAPHAGAWIETVSKSSACRKVEVAPHAGAWIETLNWRVVASAKVCRPPRGGVD